MELNAKTSTKNINDDTSKQTVFNSFIGMNLGEDNKNHGMEGLIEVKFALQDPVKLNFSIKVNRHIKISLMKTKIVDKLRDENNKLIKKINGTSFILMRKHNILRENLTLDEAGIKDKETLHILMKANINDKEDKQDKKKKNQSNAKNLIVPMQMTYLGTLQN